MYSGTDICIYIYPSVCRIHVHMYIPMIQQTNMQIYSCIYLQGGEDS